MNLIKRIEHLEVRARRVASTVPIDLDVPADVLDLLTEQVNALRADATIDPAERARTVGALGGLALRAMDARDILARVEAVERVLKLRRDALREQQQKKGGR
jgi:hypothetical protein